MDRLVSMTVMGSVKPQTTPELAELDPRGRAERVRSVDALAPRLAVVERGVRRMLPLRG
jgi:hypothetical protein